MKKFSLIILVLVIVLSCFTLSVSAETTYDVANYIEITNDNTVFRFKNDHNFELFTLTKGCFVKQLTTSANMHGCIEVEYNGLKGYVLESSLISETTSKIETTEGIVDINNIPTDLPAGMLIRPYHKPLTVTVNNPVNLATYPGDYPDSTAVAKNDSLIVFGTYTRDTKLYLYVQHSKSGSVGAILASDTNFDITTDKIVPYSKTEQFQQEVKPQKPGEQDNTPSGTNNTPTHFNILTVLLIIGICIPAILIVFLIFKPVRPESSRYASENPKRYQDFDEFDD